MSGVGGPSEARHAHLRCTCSYPNALRASPRALGASATPLANPVLLLFLTVTQLYTVHHYCAWSIFWPFLALSLSQLYFLGLSVRTFKLTRERTYERERERDLPVLPVRANPAK